MTASTGLVYPASSFQTRGIRLARIAREAGDGQGDNIVLAYRLRGRLDESAIGRALGLVVARHEPLRTVFPADAEPPLAEVLFAPVRVDVERVHPNGHRDDAAAVEALAGLSAERLDVTGGPVFKASLVDLGDDDALMVVAYDHIVGDGVMSTGILANELAASYRAYTSGTDPELVPLTRTYSGFAEAHRRTLTRRTRAAVLDYWRARFPPGSADPPLVLQPLSEGSDRRTGSAAAVERHARPRLAAELPALRRRHRVTNFVLFLAGLMAALRVRTGQDRVGALIPVDVRAKYGMNDLIGRFSNLAVVWMPVAPSQRMDDLVAQVARRVREAIQHADVPYGDLIEDLRPDRYSRVDGPPYVFFSAAVASPAAWSADGLTAMPVRLSADARTTPHPGLKVVLAADTGGVRMSCQYVRAAYAPDTVAAVLDLAIGAVEMLAVRPDAVVDDLAGLDTRAR